MSDKITVKTIVADWLKDNQFDGLCNDDCGCGVDELFSPCTCFGGENCQPAFKGTCLGCGEVTYSGNKFIGKCQDCQED